MPTKYVTSAIPYVNAQPHLGHVLEWFQADVLARFYRLQGNEVEFTCGTDENSLKNVQAAQKANQDIQTWLDEYAQVFENSFKDLNISLTRFRRGSDKQKHWPGVQQLWQRCAENNDIYSKEYTGLYCVGCEMYYTKDELVDGKCPEHLTEPEEITETNYFFRLSKYEKQIKDLIESDQLQIISDQYKQEMLGFINQGLEDFSISRSVERAKGIGVPVPGDDSQVMYVWFDALSIYLTAIGWGYDQKLFDEIWPADTHVIGKGINRFHSVYWIGMLLSSKLPLPKNISVHGYITVNEQKMSKSLGNVVDPFQLINDYGLEPVRYYLLKHIPTHGDGDFSVEKFIISYNADLANGIGNLCSRVATLANQVDLPGKVVDLSTDQKVTQFISDQELQSALDEIMSWVARADQFLSEHKPWAETDEAKKRENIQAVVDDIQKIGHHLQPFLPTTSKKIIDHFSQEKIAKFKQPLFPRLK